MNRFREWSSRGVNGARGFIAGRLCPLLHSKFAGRFPAPRTGFRFGLDRRCRMARREFLMRLGAVYVAWPGLRGHLDNRLLGLSRKPAMFSRKT
jgi:hypothetical protein